MRLVPSEWVLRGALATTVVLAMAGCFKGNFANCAVSCATNADCPGELACSAQGVCSVGGSSCEGMMPMPDADLTKPQALTVTKTGDGAVTSVPTGIDCGATCMFEYPPLSSVTLTATPGAGSVFEGWTGDCASSTSTDCTLTMDGPKTAGAKFAQHGALRWVKQISYSGTDFLDGDVTVDANGDVVASGSINDAGASKLYIVKYSGTNGQIIWEKTIEATNFSFNAGGVATDAAGNAYVCTRFSGLGSTTIGTTNVTADLYGNIVALRLAAATGNIDWVKQWGGSGQDVCNGVVVSGANVFFTGGTSSSPSTFDGVILSGAGVDSGYVVKAATSNGNVSAGQVLIGQFILTDISENAGAIAIAGITLSTFNGTNSGIPACTINVSGAGRDGFIMAFANDLTCQWARGFGSTAANVNSGADMVAGVPGGGWVVTGGIAGVVNFGGSTSISANGGDAFLARYSATGTYVYSFGYGGPGNDYGRGVAVLPTGEIVLVGEFGSTVTFGTTVLTGTNDVFITRLSSGVTPIHQWATKVGGTAYDTVNSLAIDPQGTVTVNAVWSGMTDVGGTPLTGQDYDAWVAQFVR